MGSNTTINLVLASSQQRGLGCSMGDSEQAHMYVITQMVYDDIAKDDRFNPYLVPLLTKDDTQNLIDTVILSNNFIRANGGTGYHVGLHSDGGAYARGASGLYVSEGGKALAQAIFDEVAAITPWSDIGLRQRTGLWELNQTDAYACIIEVSFHDIPEEAEWIHTNQLRIADAIVRGIYKRFGLERPAGIDWQAEAEKYKAMYEKVVTELKALAARY